MNTIFSINFRREAFQRERARTRRRAVNLGLWVLYFGVLGVMLESGQIFPCASGKSEIARPAC